MRKAVHFATLCKIVVLTSMPQASARRIRLLLTPHYEEKDHTASKPWAIVLESEAIPREPPPTFCRWMDVGGHAHCSGNQFSYFAQPSYKACAQDRVCEGSLTLRHSTQVVPEEKPAPNERTAVSLEDFAFRISFATMQAHFQ